MGELIALPRNVSFVLHITDYQNDRYISNTLKNNDAMWLIWHCRLTFTFCTSSFFLHMLLCCTDNLSYHFKWSQLNGRWFSGQNNSMQYIQQLDTQGLSQETFRGDCIGNTFFKKTKNPQKPVLNIFYDKILKKRF